MLMTWCYLVKHVRVRKGDWKGALESKGSGVNVMKTKMMLSRENTEKVATEGKFPCSVYGKVVESNSILY